MRMLLHLVYVFLERFFDMLGASSGGYLQLFICNVHTKKNSNNNNTHTELVLADIY